MRVFAAKPGTAGARGWQLRGDAAQLVEERVPPEGGTPCRTDYMSNFTSTKKLLQLPPVGKVLPATQ